MMRLNSSASTVYTRRPRRKPRVEWPDWLSTALKTLKPPEQITVSQWADRYRILDSKTSAEPGQWRTARTPYLQGIMDAFNDPDIEEIIFCKPTQVGGTESLQNTVGFIIAQDPAPVLIVYPTLLLAEFTSKNRLQPMIDLCPVLQERYHEEESKLLELQFDGMYIVLAGANSPASLASRPIRYLLLDEVDKYPVSSGNEADPISLARERTKTFAFNKKILMTSTPTVKKGPIWQAMEQADELRRYYVPCPHCGHYQIFRFKQIKWPKEVKDPSNVQEIAWYECEKCKGIINDSHKASMLSLGRWQAERKGHSSRKVAFHLNAIYSPWVRFGDCAYEFLKSKDIPVKLKNFINSWLAEPWEQTEVKMNSDIVLERQSEYEEGIVPDDAIIITGGVDVQKYCFYWTIRAWGASLTSWNIAHGMADTWDQIEQIMNSFYSDRYGNEYQVNLCGIDSGDRTDEVYEFCALNGDWAVPVKGSSNPLLARYSISVIDKVDSKAYGSKLYIVDTDQYKDMIAARMKRPNGPGSWMVFKGCDREYAEQICAEEKDTVKKGSREIETWQPKTTHAANHYLDCEVYAALAADLLHVRYLAAGAAEQTGENRSTPARQEQQSGFIKTSGDWINQKDRWLR